MSGPHWLPVVFAGLMIATSAYCVGRLVLARVRSYVLQHDVDVVHVAMGVSMAGMLVPALDPVGNRPWEVVFGTAIAWFVYDAARSRITRGGSVGGHHLSHVVLCGTMVYMLAIAGGVAARAAASGGQTAGMAGMSGHPGGSPVVIALLAVVMLGYVVWTTDRLAVVTAGGHSSGPSASLFGEGAQVAAAPAARPFLAPRMASCCEIAMCVTMGYMLVAML